MKVANDGDSELPCNYVSLSVFDKVPDKERSDERSPAFKGVDTAEYTQAMTDLVEQMGSELKSEIKAELRKSMSEIQAGIFSQSVSHHPPPSPGVV